MVVGGQLENRVQEVNIRMNYKFMKPYPLWRVEYEQVPNGESKNDIYRVLVKIAKNANWFELYKTYSSAWAEIALKKLQDIFDLYVMNFIVDEDNLPPMFEIHDQIYKTVYVFPQQSCIVGENIAGNSRYGEFSVDGLKFDYVKDTIFFYEYGTALIKCNQLFIDGKLVLNSKELKYKCDEIGQDFNKLDLYPEKIIQYIVQIAPYVSTYICNTYAAYNINRR